MEVRVKQDLEKQRQEQQAETRALDEQVFEAVNKLKALDILKS